jgi:hypothetical protein
MTRFSRVSKNPKVPAKVKHAFELMQADPKIDAKGAAAAAGISYYNFRRALKLPHVALWARETHKAKVNAICAANPERLRAIADTSENDMARVTAVKTLEAMRESIDQSVGAGQHLRGPGLQIVILQRDGSSQVVAGPTPAPVIDVTPDLEHDPLISP